jgi:non-specific serine/threonine protein kinase
MNKSLLLRAETSAVATCPLYFMLDTVRAYATRELAAAGERDGALEGLVRYCMHEASLAADGLVGLDQVEWLDRVREDLESYRAALTWLLDGGRVAEACHIAWSLFYFWIIRGHAAEGLGWYEQILNRSALPPVVESKALIGAGTMRYTRGDLTRARTELTRAVALAREDRDLQMLARAAHVFGHVELAAGNCGAAGDLLACSLDQFRALAVPWGTGSALIGLAWVAVVTGDAGRATRLLDDATTELRDAGPWFLSAVSYLRAILAVRRGNADETIALIRESLRRIAELRDKFAFVYALVPLAAAARLKGDDAWAARILGAREAVTDLTGATVVDTSVDDLREQAEREVRARLGPDQWARAYAAGRMMSIDALLKDIEGIVGPQSADMKP